VRTGLVVVGLAVALVGAGLTLSAFFEPGAPNQTRVNSFPAPNLQPGEPRTVLVWLHNTSSGSLALNWVASSNVNLSLYRAQNCAFMASVNKAEYCPAGAALASWPSASSGHWNTSGTILFPYLLNLQNLGPKEANVSAVFDEQWPSASPSVPTWIFLSALAGGIVCLSIGGIAVFLGLFLRSGVYSTARGERASAPPPSEDDGEALDPAGPEPPDEEYDEPPP
jgi:hypothetical protein